MRRRDEERKEQPDDADYQPDKPQHEPEDEQPAHEAEHRATQQRTNCGAGPDASVVVANWPYRHPARRLQGGGVPACFCLTSD